MKTALIISFSTLSRAPRILRQISWLTSKNWEVDCVGLGPTKPLGARNFFEVPLTSAWKRYLIYLLADPKSRFDSLFGKGIPSELLERVHSYDLIVLNELEYSPHELFQKLFTSPKPPMLYVDLHENHLATAASNIFEKLAFERYWNWQLAEFKSLTENYPGTMRFSSVESRIAGLYEKELHKPVAVIRNAPAWAKLSPSTTKKGKLRIVHHGMGTRNRGIETSIRALRRVPQATLDLYLVSGWFYKLKVKVLSGLFGVSARVVQHDPVPTSEIAKTINSYDLATVIIPPATENHLHALPNKFFESIQANLGLVIGPNPSMSHFVREEAIGIVLGDWSAKSLAGALGELSIEDIDKFKKSSHAASKRFSSLEDNKVFTKLLGL